MHVATAAHRLCCSRPGLLWYRKLSSLSENNDRAHPMSVCSRCAYNRKPCQVRECNLGCRTPSSRALEQSPRRRASVTAAAADCPPTRLAAWAVQRCHRGGGRLRTAASGGMCGATRALEAVRVSPLRRPAAWVVQPEAARVSVTLSPRRRPTAHRRVWWRRCRLQHR